jgi:hypothetical protein
MRLLQVEQVRAEAAERMGDQPGNVHLGDAEPLADLRLRHTAAKAHQQDLLLTRDDATIVAAIARATGVCRVVAEVLPEHKASKIQRLPGGPQNRRD